MLNPDFNARPRRKNLCINSVGSSPDLENELFMVDPQIRYRKVVKERWQIWLAEFDAVVRGLDPHSKTSLQQHKYCPHRPRLG